MMLAFLLLAAAPAQGVCDIDADQVTLNQCNADAFAAADKELNAQWKLTLAYMQQIDRDTAGATDPSDKRPGYAAQLRIAQRAWIAFRDAHCLTIAYEMRGGSGEPMLEFGCKATLTRERTKQLKDLVLDQ